LPPKVAGIIHAFRKRSPMNLSLKYPAVDAAGLALLRAMLHFDPSKRAVVDEALHHPFLTEEQSDEKEFDAVCSDPMSAEIESLSEENLEHLTDAVSIYIYIYHSFCIKMPYILLICFCFDYYLFLLDRK